MSEIIQLPGTERGMVPIEISEGVDPDKVLKGAIGNLREVIIVGIDEDGDLYLAASEPSIAEVVLLLHKAINQFVYLSDKELIHYDEQL